MKSRIPLISVIVLSLIFITGCDFLGGIFKTGVGVGVVIAIIILVIIFFIARIGKKH
jgi:hypothetical protein